MPSPFYNLIAVAGITPQIITETAFELHQEGLRQEMKHGRIPQAVHIVTTHRGKAFVEALLLGKEQQDPQRHRPIEGAAPRWATFCEEVFQGRQVDLQFHVPQDAADGLVPDIRRRGDDTMFANLCYRLVEELTRPDEPPLIGSIAGGRKTMSAHLMTAFSVYARPEDRLTHVLAHPRIEQDRSFFYPEAPEDLGLLDLVNVRFPRLNELLKEDLIDGLPEDRRDLRGILDTLDPHLDRARDVDAIELHLMIGEARLVFTLGSGETRTCRLTPATAATLAVFADAIYESGEPVPVTAWVSNDSDDANPASSRTEAQRRAVMRQCNSEGTANPKPWTKKKDLSSARWELNKKIEEVPLAERYLAVQNLSGSPVRYALPDGAPQITVATEYDEWTDWPFDHIEVDFGGAKSFR